MVEAFYRLQNVKVINCPAGQMFVIECNDSGILDGIGGIAFASRVINAVSYVL